MDESQAAHISSASFLDLYDAFIDLGLISADEDIGIQRSALLDVEKRIPVAMQTRLWSLAKHSDCPEHIGLLVGSQLNKDARGILSHLIRHADDLRDALYLYQQYITVMSDNERVEVDQTSWGCRVSIDCRYDASIYISSVERSLSALVTWGRDLTGKMFYPLQVSVVHPQQRYHREYQKIFGDTVCYQQPSVFIDIGNEVLDLANVNANRYLRKILQSHVDDFLLTLNNEASLPLKVRQLIESRMANDDFSSQAIADVLNISRQTLHRRLKKEGTGFRVILAALRKSKAVEYLADSDIPIDQISGLLGFKEASAFHRAFKLWCHESPGSFRLQLLNQ